MRRVSLPSWQTLRKVWGKVAIVIVVVAIAAAVTAFAWAVNNSGEAKQSAAAAAKSSAAAASSSKTSARFARANLISQNNHHTATVKADAAIENAEGAIAYEGGVITYLLGEITASQQAGHQTLAELQSLQEEINVELPNAVAALRTGQAQINAYLAYLTCLDTSTKTDACGAAPPLPPT